MRTQLIALAIVVGASACAKQDGGTLGQAESQSAGDALGTGVEDGASTYGPMNSVSSLVDANPCVTLSGDVADTDLDNIPANATLTLACTDTSLGFTGMVTGTLTVMDTQPTAVAWAFTGNADLHNSLTGPGGASIVSDRIGTLTATQGSAAGPFNLARSLDVVTVLKSAAGASVTVTETTGWTLGFTPSVTWTPGGVVVGGDLAASGTWEVTVGNKAASATIATPTPLTVTPSCSTRVTAGTVTGTYETAAVTHTITVTWTGCGQRTVTYTER
jgi:hypothetical protein